MENLKESCWKLRMVTRYIFYPLNGVWIMNRDWTVSDTGNWILTLNRIFTSRWMGFFLFWLMLPFKTKPSKKKKQAPVNDDERMRNRMLIFTIRKWQFPPVQLRQWMTEIYWTNGTNFPSWHLCKKKKKKYISRSYYYYSLDDVSIRKRKKCSRTETRANSCHSKVQVLSIKSSVLNELTRWMNGFIVLL